MKYVKEKHGVNMLSCICAIDRANSSAADGLLLDVDVCGIHELVGMP